MNEDGIDLVVQKHGWHAVHVFDTKPPFLYTQGFIQTLQSPEIIVFGLDGSSLHTLCSATFKYLRNGGIIRDGVPIDAIIPQYSVAFMPVHPDHYESYLGWSMGYSRHTGKKLAARQLFWPDLQNKFPFEHGCAEQVWAVQPQLTRPAPKSSSG